MLARRPKGGLHVDEDGSLLPWVIRDDHTILVFAPDNAQGRTSRKRGACIGGRRSQGAGVLPTQR
jgi:hypothetical protein